TRLQADIEKLVSVLREEIEALREVSAVAVLQFVVGWLHHMRQMGAIYVPVLDGYLANKGNDYLLNRILWMPGFGRAHRPPAAISLVHVSQNFEALVLGNRDTWSVGWLKKTLASEHIFAAAEARQIFDLLLRTLSRSGWLHEHPCAGDVVYLLEPARLNVTTDVATASCDACRHAVHIAGDLANVYEGMRCPRTSCMGHLSTGEPQLLARTFGRSEPRRLVPHEHTGLLPRDTRERIESSFIHGHEPWDYNLLSATPTLEMGIDIGALSSIFLCSVPPAQANYLQRIGRAGRRDGNALALTVANGRNHDLFFYADPREMMAGQVHTPGVFLRAIAVLERQLIAYCFDRWAASGIDDSAIPGKLRHVLNAAENGQLDRFPYNLFDFVKANRAQILDGFFGLFDTLTDDARGYLAAFLEPSSAHSLSHRLLERLARLSRERESLDKQVKRLKRELDRLREQPKDEATNELLKAMERERSALLALMSSINSRQTLNFFTDEGLLPNYAFPEEGVTLQSVILRRKTRGQTDEDGSPYERVAYSFQRPAQAALGELAPDATFYAVSHRLTIDQVDLQLSEPEDWRFCDQCQYSENVAREDRHSACPRCGSAQWANIGQKHKVLRLRQLYSTVSDRRDRIGDDSEQREPTFFNRQMLVDIPTGGNQGGWRLKSETLPFGFEFLRKVVLREVNFGVRGGQSNKFSVAGEEQSRQGFHICRHCGKVQKAHSRANEKQHAYACKLYRHPDQASDEDFLDSLYLYRELESEAIRILLPLSEVAYSDVKLDSFVAALNLGLKLHFRGNVHHLQVTHMREPASEGSGERLYLLIYDRIPGGTGYLKDLMREPGIIFNVLALAHQHLLECACVEDVRLDGCYRCVLAYRDSRHMPTISRRAAAELLGDILLLRDQIESVASLGEISTNTLIESKLEQKFVDALARLDGAQMSHEVFHGKNGELLSVPGADGHPVAWHVEHQVKVGPGQGVAAQTEIDVLLTPARSEDARRYRPIAVYMDGLQYHHDIVDEDVYKRMALLLSGRYWVVSLNWDDLPEPGQMAKPIENDLMRAHGPQQPMLERFCETLYGIDRNPTPNGSMQWFSGWLRAPGFASGDGTNKALRSGFTLLYKPDEPDASVRRSVADELQQSAPTPVCQMMD
ncbi:MAG: Zn-binding domain-containing protein, partial [Gammaproteobacteria bacterium]